ncbi:phage tail tape measure protein [Priestia aryabhattai]
MTERIQGLSIGLDLNTLGVDTGMTQLRSKMRLVNSEMKANLSAFERGEKSLGLYQDKVDGLNKKLEVQRAMTEKARQTYEKMVEVHGEGSIKAQNAAKDFNNESAKLQNLTRDANKAAQELHDFSEEQRVNESTLGKMSTKLNEMGSSLTNVGQKMKSMGQSLSLSVTAPIVGIGAAAAKTSIEFEAQMSKVGAISQATSGEMKQLKESALDLGASTSKSASEVAKGQENLAAMGFSVNEILGAMPGVISAAEASGADMAQTADVMASSLNIFGLKASDATKVADILAQTANQSAADITDMQYALKYAGPPAAALGVSLEETSAAIGIMTNAGMQGEQAGTTLRAALLGLLDPSEENSKLMNKMGIEITDAKGNFVGISKLIDNLSTSLEGQTETQKAATLSSLVGTEAVSGMLSLMKAGPEDIDKMTKSLEQSGGSSAESAKKMKDNLKGALDEMSGAFETAGIKIGEIMTPALTKLAGIVQSVVQKFIDLPKSIQTTIIVFAGIVAAIGPLLVVGGVLLGFIGNIVSGFSTLLPIIARAGGFFNVLRIGLAALTGPVGIVIGALTLLGIGFVTLYKKSDTFRNFINNAWDSIKNKAMQVFSFLKPYISSAITAVTSFIQQKLSMIKQFWADNGTQIMQALKNIWSGISAVFQSVMSVIVPIVKTGLTILMGVFNFVFPFVLALVKSVWGNIKGIIDGALKVIMGLVKVFSGLFTGDFSKMWSGLKDIFFGSIQIIWNYVQLQMFGKLLSLGKVFIGGFRGIFVGLWNGLKSLFTSGAGAAKNAVVGAWNLLKSVTITIFNAYKTYLTTVFNLIKTVLSKIASGIVTAIRGSWNLLKTVTTTIFNTYKSFLVGIWNFLKGIFTRTASTIVNAVRGSWNTLKSTTTGIFNGVKNFLSGMWSGTKTLVTNAASKTKDGVVNAWSTLRNKTTEMFTSIKDKTKKIFGDIVDGAKALPGKIGSGIKSMAGKVQDGVKAIGQKLAGGLETVINTITQKGINVVLDKIGVDKKNKIPALNIPGYKNGTDGHPKDGPAFVGDGGEKELLLLPNGRMFLSPNRTTLVPNMPKDTQVLNGKQTRQFFSAAPMYKKGTNPFADGAKKAWDWTKDNAGKAVNKGKEVASAAKEKASDALGDIYSYIDNPKKLLDKVFSSLNIKMPNVGGLMGTLAKSGVTKIKDGAVNFIKKMFGDFGGSVGAPSGKGVARWRPVILKAAAMMKESVTGGDVNAILRQIQRESGGNEKITQSSAVRDINTRNGNPARGLLQYIPQTFRAYAMKSHGNIYNGFDQLLAFFNNTTWRRDNPGGTRGWGPRGKRKYKNGTKYHIGGDALLGDGYEVEPFLLPNRQLGFSPDKPTLFNNLPKGTKVWSSVQDFIKEYAGSANSNRTDAMKLVALAGKKLQRDQSSGSDVFGTSQSRYGNDDAISILRRVEELLQKIADKSTSFTAELDGEALIDFIENEQAINGSIRKVWGNK